MDGQKLVGHNYALTYDLGNGRTIQVNGNFYADDDAAAMNAKLDKLRGVLDRQRAKSDLEIMRAEMKQRAAVRETIIEGIVLLEAEQAKQGPRWPQQQRAALEQQKRNLAKVEKDIADGKDMLAEAERKAA